jgi:hypothetical protein
LQRSAGQEAVTLAIVLAAQSVTNGAGHLAMRDMEPRHVSLLSRGLNRPSLQNCRKKDSRCSRINKQVQFVTVDHYEGLFPLLDTLCQIELLGSAVGLFDKYLEKLAPVQLRNNTRPPKNNSVA